MIVISKQNNTTKIYIIIFQHRKGKIEVLHKVVKSQSELSQEIGRKLSTISRKLKRGTDKQMKIKNEKVILL